MRNRAARRIGGLLAAAFTLAALSCSNDPSAWYPSGSAAVASFYEIPGSGACEITLKIANTGRSTISSYCVSIAAATEVRTYYRTICGNLSILPGGSAYASTEIIFATEAESLAADGLSVVDAFFQ